MNQTPVNNEEGQIKKKFSVLQGFNVCLLFFDYLWPLVEPKTAELDEETALLHVIFFCDICLGFESSPRWNESIFRVKGIPKEEQKKGLMLSEEDLFQCSIEFFNFSNEKLELKLQYTSNLLESMKTNPQNHSTEWSLWKKAVADSYNTYVVSQFDWHREEAGCH